MIGKTISHYKILEKLGSGGMGIVYKAQDLKLDRFVALKFLPPHLTTSDENKQRFIHEAKAASTLEHNNICNIHEIDETEDGQLFISMAYYEGKTLDKRIKEKPLPIEEAINIAIQIALGLAKAHEVGIVHRDIKPANIMLTADGVVKILDFGLAKLSTQTKLTKEGTSLGTVSYMSPEQAKGEEVDYRTDIWSLGIVIYEMLSGQLPFKGEYDSAVIYSIVNDAQEPLTTLRTGVPIELERIINKCLQKSAADRYQHIDELVVDLRSLKRDAEFISTSIKVKPANKQSKSFFISVTVVSILILVVAGYFFIFEQDKNELADAGTQKWENSIAVLPFDDLSPEGDQEWFCDGMTEQIITNLSKINRLKVIGRTSVMKFKNTEKTLPEIGKELNVSHILEGSIRKYGESIRVTAQLINTKDGSHLWADDYDKEYEHLFEVQDDVSQAIAAILLATFSPQEQIKIRTNRPSNMEAYEYYLKGKVYYRKGLEADIKKAIEYFERAIKIDSTYSLGYTGIALAYSILGDFHILEPILCWQKMQNATEKALIFDNELAEAYNTSALVKVYYKYDWQGAEREFKRAIELNPNNPDIRNGYGLYLTVMRRFPEALIQFENGLRLDPFSLVMLQNYILCLYYSGQTEKAIMIAENAIVQDSVQVNPLWYWVLAHLRGYQGKYERAVELTQIQIKLMGDDISDEIAFLGELYAQIGLKKEAQEVLEDLNELSDKGKYISPLVRASIYLNLGDIDKAMELIEEGYNKRDGWMPWIIVMPEYNLLWNDPRFISLTKKMGFK